MQEPDPDATRELLASRYGTRRPGRRLALVVASVLLAGAALGWLAWAALFHSDPAIAAEVSGYDVRNSHRIDATVQMRLRDRDVTGSCLLRATAEDHSVVGEVSFRVEDAAASGRRTFPVRTERLATTVEVVRCTPDE